MINFEGNSPVKKLVFTKWDKILPVDEIKNLLTKIRARAEFEMTDTGTFKPIIEQFTNHKPVVELGEVSLNIKSSSNLNNSTERILETVVSTKSGQYTTQKVLAQGKRDDILEVLNKEDFSDNFKKYLAECSDDFEKKGLE